MSEFEVDYELKWEKKVNVKERQTQNVCKMLFIRTSTWNSRSARTHDDEAGRKERHRMCRKKKFTHDKKKSKNERRENVIKCKCK